MPSNTRKATKYNQIIGILKDGSAMVLEDTFQYEDGFKGATGFTMTPMLQQYIDEMNEPEQLKYLWEEAVAANATEDSLEDWTEACKAEIAGADRTYFPFDDPSFRDEMDEAYNRLTADQKAQFDQAFGEKDKDFVDWTSGSCGRCVETDPDCYEVILNPDLLKVAQAAEA